ncbi:MAG TPA: PIG-L family deacetylase [Alphaproteobacteria bacterium]|jgi:LmbE family N-acetylglucosaminyl deacetylase|nr:PIG-L family deacetylase [Alphaproteobacteria bacterium]
MDGAGFIESLDCLPLVPLDRILGPGGLIVIAPHPDDETLGCGGLIARARSEGRAVRVVILSDGSLSHQGSRDYPPDRLRTVRQQESTVALEMLGVSRQDIHFLDIKDGSVPAAGGELVAVARQVLDIVRPMGGEPGTIAVTWRDDPHPDHKAAYEIAHQVRLWLPALKLIEYPIWGSHESGRIEVGDSVNGYRLDIAGHTALKHRAILAYRSQVTDLITDAPGAGPLPERFLERFRRPHEVFLDLPHRESPWQITRRVHQIMLVDGFTLPNRLPHFVTEHAAELKVLYPAAEYRLWDGHALRAMIAEHFEPEVLAAFDLLRPYAYKADLARYCLLYVFGGLYVDLAIRGIDTIKPPPGVGLASFRDDDLQSPSWTAALVGIIWAVPGRREFRIAIDYVVENCARKFYGANPLYPTGPVLFGRALAAAMAERKQQEDADDQWIGQRHAATPGKPQQNISYIAPDCSLVGLLRKTVAGDLTRLGASGTNNYISCWHGKAIYGEPVSVWPFDDPGIRLTEQALRTGDGIAALPDASGILTFGPYIDAAAGLYRLTVLFDREEALPRMIVDVVCDHGESRLHEHEQAAHTVADRIAFTFAVPRAVSFLEFRPQTYGRLAAKIARFTLERLDSQG